MTSTLFECKINNELFGSMEWEERVERYICEVGPSIKALPTKMSV
jgi:hypothetical protein